MNITTSRSCSRTALAAVALSALALAACANDPAPDPRTPGGGADQTLPAGVQPTSEETGSTAGAADDTDDDTATTEVDAAQETSGVPGPEEAAARPTHEAPGPSARLAIGYDGGVLVLDAATLETVGDFTVEGFARLNPAGDGRHLFVTEGDAFRLLDAGTWSIPHGNHDHSYTTEPFLSPLRIEGSHPGHVVTHAGTTALYFDGDGRIDLLDPATLDVTATEIELTESREVDDPHHGVAVVLNDGLLLETVGTEDERTGARVVDADGQVVASTDECPGVHGEAHAADHAIVLGCEDGLVIYRDGEFTKVTSPDDYGRIGNQAGSDLSPVVLGDYKNDPDAEQERPEQVSLTDTRTGELRMVDLGTSYTFRSLARGPQGEALVLGTDGAVHVIDPEGGQVTDRIQVTGEWEEPSDWQLPRPSILVVGQFGYVTEPATQELHLIDLDTMTVIDHTHLPVVPNEISGVDGRHHQ